MDGNLASVGLVLAGVMSVVNVLTDISRKKVLDRSYDAALISFWCKAVAFVAYVVAVAALMAHGTRLELPDLGKTLGLPQWPAFMCYLVVNAFLEGTAIVLNLRALQVSPISYCVPFMAMTPLFLLPAGHFFLHETIVPGMVIGVSLVVLGSLVVNRRLFAHGFMEPVKAIFREKGSRYMLMVALILTVTNVLDKWFVTGGGAVVPFDVRLSRSITLSLAKCIMLALFFAGLTVMRLGDWKKFHAGTLSLAGTVAGFNWTKAWRDVPVWLMLAGLLESGVLVLQLTSMQFTAAALVISIKRSGIILAVVLGWFVFKERGITDRVIASFVMLSGVLIFFLTKPDAQNQSILGMHGALGVAALAVVGMGIALALTHRRVVGEGS